MNTSMQSRNKRAVWIKRRPSAGNVRSREPPGSGKTLEKSSGKRRRWSALTCFFMKLIVIIFICVVVHVFIADIHIQQGNRMYPFLMDGDLLIISKLSDYMAGDAVLYRNPENGKKDISRIAAMGQNEILITEEGQLLVNRFVPDDQVFYPTQPLADSEIRYPFRMEEGMCFLLDDFRTQGRDSRQFGEVAEDELLGKVIYVFRRREI